MKSLLVTVTWLLALFATNAIATPNTFTVKGTVTKDFPEIGHVQNVSLGCPIGSTLITAHGYTLTGNIVANGVRIENGGPPGVAARVSFRRVADQSEIFLIASGGTPAPVVNQKLKLRAECLRGINVQKYGAVGDGVTDDIAAFNAALSDVPDDGILYVPSGNYVISTSISINKRMRVIGDGLATQIFHSDTGSDLFVVTARGVTIKDLFLGSASTLPDTALINLQRAHNVHIDNIVMVGGHYGIWVFGAVSGHVENVKTFTNLAGPAFFEQAGTSTNQVWIRTQRDTVTIPANPNSVNAFVFINPRLEGGTRCFHHTDFGGQGNINIFGGTIQGCTDVGLLVEGNGAPVNVVGVHFESNDVLGDKIDVRANTSFGLTLDGVVSTGKIDVTGSSTNVAIRGSKINELDIGPSTRRVSLINSIHSLTGGIAINDQSRHALYMINSPAGNLLSTDTTTIGLGTNGPPLSSVDGDLHVNGTVKASAFVN